MSEKTWFTNIQTNWDLLKIGSVFNLRNQKVNDVDYAPLSVSKGGIVPQISTVAKSDAHDSRKLVLKGDFVINSRSDRKMSCGVSKFDGSVSLINLVLEPNKIHVDPNYVNFLLKNYGFAEEFYKWGHGIVADLWTTGWDEMKVIYIPVPPLPVQNKIVETLDDKISKIDTLIQNENKQIVKLEEYKKAVITKAVTKGLDPNARMKDSGVEWLGYIPKHWRVTRMQDIGTYKKGPFGSAITKNMFVEKDTNTYKVYEQKNAIQKDAKLGYYYIPYSIYEGLKDYSLIPQDIIVSCAGTIGECFIMPSNMEKGIINQALMRIRLNDNINKDFFIYVFDIVLTYANLKYSNGSAMKNIPPFSILKKLGISAPPIQEQQQIADYLDEKCEKINRIIEIKKSKKEKLQDYKKSLIYEYVTGKKEVSNV